MKLHNPFRTALVATLGVGLGILLIQGVQSLSTILLYVGTALFLSLGLDPMVSWLTRHRLPRWAAVLVTIVVVLGLFAGIALLVIPILVNQIAQLVRQITYFLQSTYIGDVKKWVVEVFPGLQPSFVDTAVTNVTNWFNANWGSITESVVAVGTSIIAGVAGAFIILILTIYFTAAIPSLKGAVYQLVPASRRERFIDLAEQITASVGYYVMGQVSMGVINGLLSMIFLSIIQAPFPTVLAVVAFCFSLIPLVGTLTGSTLIVLVCLIPGAGSPLTALVAAIYYLVYMQIEAYVISPRVMNRAVSVPGAVVVIAALAGGALLGLLGALIAIPVAASVLILYRQVLIPRMNER